MGIKKLTTALLFIGVASGIAGYGICDQLQEPEIGRVLLYEGGYYSSMRLSNTDVVLPEGTVYLSGTFYLDGTSTVVYGR